MNPLSHTSLQVNPSVIAELQERIEVVRGNIYQKDVWEEVMEGATVVFLNILKEKRKGDKYARVSWQGSRERWLLLSLSDGDDYVLSPRVANCVDTRLFSYYVSEQGREKCRSRRWL